MSTKPVFISKGAPANSFLTKSAWAFIPSLTAGEPAKLFRREEKVYSLASTPASLMARKMESGPWPHLDPPVRFPLRRAFQG
ncbi:hypothetical protein IEQ34_006794 [Dendrobium chrysotoxum]|uniref:Uncharacterized protein n=1 Tax=Dendrobium chrysotoxum TaxID=161865 RepID=A0AAV7H7U1_DENCH|nr:hypothetical protein IEQ34_006794 [Dendrobium chrysotoxum]